MKSQLGVGFEKKERYNHFSDYTVLPALSQAHQSLYDNTSFFTSTQG